jgi:hypothetical protein
LTINSAQDPILARVLTHSDILLVAAFHKLVVFAQKVFENTSLDVYPVLIEAIYQSSVALFEWTIRELIPLREVCVSLLQPVFGAHQCFEFLKMKLVMKFCLRCNDLTQALRARELCQEISRPRL